jgi:transposase-like protein
MKPILKNEVIGQGARVQLLLPEILRKTVLDTVMEAGMEALREMLEEERSKLCGPRYAHGVEREAWRAGYAPSELAMGGRRVSIPRPRVRSKAGEVPLPSWERFASEDPLSQRAVEQVMVGVSTRKYARSLEPMPPSMKTRGASRSAVSRRFVESTAEHLERLMKENLSRIDLVAVIIDGLHVGDYLILVALGIDAAGNKHVLGLYEGATENATACKGLLADLESRGMRTDRSLLFVIDGSKALYSAIRAVFGERALVQRCQVHKRRNVEDHLPEGMKLTIGRAITKAYRSRDPQRAERILEGLARQLEREHPQAAASLREGLAETLTVLNMELPEWLERTLATTNPIENLNGSIRRITRNVKRWDDGRMVLRWVAASLAEARKGFRKLRGYKGMPKLMAALRAHDAALGITLDAEERAA